MGFWKKSEDPWDQDPERRRPPLSEPGEPEEESPGLMGQLRGWKERRKSPLEEPEGLPMACPWCGKDMEQGYLYPTGRGEIWWLREKLDLKAKLIGPDPKSSLLVTDEGVFYTYKTTWYCEACKKMALDATGLRPPGEVDIPALQQAADGDPATEEITEEKET